MRDEQNKFGTASHSRNVGISIVSAKNLPERKFVQCSACLQQMEYTDNHQRCDMCGSGLNTGESVYSGYEPALVPMSPDVYHLRPPVRTGNERRYARIPCRNEKACIKTELSSNIVNLINISRGGVCFSSAAHFRLGTQISIATHYIEGGHNIFQDGTIIRVQSRATDNFPGEYAVEFAQQPASRKQ